MPSRISLPKLHLFSSRHSSSSSSSSSVPASGPNPPPPPPPTPTPTPTPAPLSRGHSTGSTPTSPPARLHLRSILPASPDEPPIMPPPPRTPRAWVWQCHKCLNVYRLSCTRRCLDCSHVYCVSGGKSSTSSRGKKRRRADTGLCGAEFDYVGWEQWGSWRRKVLGYEAVGRSDPAARDRAFLRRSHNCWIDCDSPSECCHRRFELAAELLRTQQYVTNQPASQPPVILGSPPTSPDDDITLYDALALEEDNEKENRDVNDNGNGEEKVPKSPKSPKSPLGQSSFLWDDDDDETDSEKTREEEKEEEEVWWAARTSFDEENGTDVHDCAAAVLDDREEDSGRPAKRLTVHNLSERDVADDDSDSDSESTGSGWSLATSESDSSSIEVTGTDGKPS
ncbi:hypothetical protein F5Y10DRAFT_37944 [Nemania abortiva]|nr:hypothetical protein F5Y10DRAFT_37944 [Nemania abortiva]